MMNLFDQFQALTDSERLADADAECAKGIIYHSYWKDASGNMLGCNSRQAQTLNFSKADDIIGLSSFDLYNEKSAEQIALNDFETLESTNAKFFIEPADTRDGQEYIAISCKKPIYSQMGKKIGLMGASLVINAREYEERYFSHQSLFNNDRIPKNNDHLSPRQIQCLICLVQGMTQKQIAQKTRLSTRTVEHYLDTVKNKLNCATRYELISKALLIPEVRRAI